MQIVFGQYSREVHHVPCFESGILFMKNKGGAINLVQKIMYFDQNYEWKAGKR